MTPFVLARIRKSILIFITCLHFAKSIKRELQKQKKISAVSCCIMKKIDEKIFVIKVLKELGKKRVSSVHLQVYGYDLLSPKVEFQITFVQQACLLIKHIFHFFFFLK